MSESNFTIQGKYTKQQIKKYVQLYDKIRSGDTMAVYKILKQLKSVKGIAYYGNVTPLHYLVMHTVSERVGKFRGSTYDIGLSIIDDLLDLGADINEKTKKGQTPLHIAAQRGDHRIASLLISRGADKNSVDELGYTPYHYALRTHNIELINLLVNPIGEYAKGSMAELYSELKWSDVKFNAEPSIYVFLGHGKENVCFQEREVLPEGYTLVTYSTCGVLAYGDDVVELMHMFTRLSKDADPTIEDKLAMGDLSILKRMKQERIVNSEFRVYKAGDKIPASIFYSFSRQNDDDDEIGIQPGYLNPSGVTKISLDNFDESKYITEDDHERRFSFADSNEEDDGEGKSVYEKAFEYSVYPTPNMIAKIEDHRLFESEKDELLSATPMEIMKKLGPGTYFFPSCRSSMCFIERKDFGHDEFNELVREEFINDTTAVENNHAENVRLTRRLSNVQQRKYFANNYNTNNNIMNEVKAFNGGRRTKKWRRTERREHHSTRRRKARKGTRRIRR